MSEGQKRHQFVSDPACIYFPVATVGTVLRQFVRVINVGPHSARLGFPQTAKEHPSLTASIEIKQGYIACGLHQDLEVQFCPENFDVIQSTVRIDGEAIGDDGTREQLQIPVYCYPAATSFRFPRLIDFGAVSVGSSHTRTLKLAVGTIPGNGAVDIIVVFEPCTLQTHLIELTLTSSQLKSESMTCTVLGKSRAGAGRDEMIRAFTGQLPVSMKVLDSDNLVEEARNKLYPNAPKGGAGHGDRVTEAAWISHKNKRRSSPPKHKKANPQAWTVPTRICHSTVARMLMDSCKPERGTASVQQEREEAAISDPVQEQLSPLDNLVLDADTKRSVFRDQMKAVKDRRKTVKLSMQLEPGQTPPTAQQVQQYQDLQAQHAASVREQEATAAAERRVVKMTSGACSFLQVPQMLPAADAGKSAASSPCQEHGEPSTGASALQAAPKSPSQELQGPSESVLQRLRCADASNELAKRASALKRFITAASIVIIRNRAQKRLCSLQGLLSTLGWEKERVREEVAVPKLLAQDKMGMRPGIDPALVRSETDTTTLVPLEYNPVNFLRTDPVEVSSFLSFEDLEVADLEVPYEYMVLGYEREQHFGYDEYVPEMNHLPMETGALDEDIQVHPCAQVSDFVPDDFDPQWFKELPAGTLTGTASVEQIGQKWSPNQSGVVTAPYPVWGMGGDFHPAPAMLAKHSCADREEAASGTLRAIAGLPMLSEKWCPQLQDHRMGSRCHHIEHAPLEGPDTAAIEAACKSQPWEDGAVEVPVKRPTHAQIAEWLPEGVVMIEQHRNDGYKHASKDAKEQQIESAIFHGRQEAYQAAQEQLHRRLQQVRQAYDEQTQALNKMAKVPSRNHVR